MGPREKVAERSGIGDRREVNRELFFSFRGKGQVKVNLPVQVISLGAEGGLRPDRYHVESGARLGR
jgi:hypothetical protein